MTRNNLSKGQMKNIIQQYFSHVCISTVNNLLPVPN